MSEVNCFIGEIKIAWEDKKTYDQLKKQGIKLDYLYNIKAERCFVYRGVKILDRIDGIVAEYE